MTSLAVECVNTGLLFFMLGLLTGMLWAKFTWGEFWSGDPKQNSAAIAFYYTVPIWCCVTR